MITTKAQWFDSLVAKRDDYSPEENAEYRAMLEAKYEFLSDEEFAAVYAKKER